MNENSQDDILLLPRKKIGVKKFEFEGRESRSWFIDERKSNLETKLDKPTAETKEALTSGLRSAIIKDEDGRYIKLKGVAPKTYISQGNYRGLCYFEETVFEIIGLLNLRIRGYPFLPYDVEFVERMPLIWSTRKPGISEVLTDLLVKTGYGDNLMADAHKLLLLPEQGTRNTAKKKDGLTNYFKKIKKFFYENDKPKCKLCYVPGYHIEGDTRLDEIIYHLTKKEYSGKQRLNRDHILTNLCLQAGVTKGFLHHGEWFWSQREKYTNNHIGNFVVYPKHGLIKVGIVDLNAAEPYDDFLKDHAEKGLTKKEIIDGRLRRELKSLKEDFFDPVTCSFPTMPRYRNFPEYLKKRCAEALGIGFDEGIKESFLKDRVIHVPASLGVNGGSWLEGEFRYELNRLLR